MNTIDRREFLAAGAATALAAGPLGAAVIQPASQPAAQPAATGSGDSHRGQCFISSANGLRAIDRATQLIASGTHPLDAVVDGIAIVEDDPSDNSVGYGGLPNEEGIVQLDASVMDGILHRAGSVGALERIKNPARVALQVMRRTDHVMLVGAGALKFALRLGFKEEDLLTDASRQAWLKWREELTKEDDWLEPGERDPIEGKPLGFRAAPIDIESGPARLGPGSIPYTTGTIHCSGVTESGHVVACTSTSGLSWKLPGRLGDSPIVGAGMYCDNAVGSAGATGRGEAVIGVCGAFSIVQHMESGKTPTEACLAVLKRMADRTREKRLLDAQGRPNFNVSLYAVRKDGAYGSACLWKGGKYSVSAGGPARLEPSAWLFEK